MCIFPFLIFYVLCNQLQRSGNIPKKIHQMFFNISNDKIPCERSAFLCNNEATDKHKLRQTSNDQLNINYLGLDSVSKRVADRSIFLSSFIKQCCNGSSEYLNNDFMSIGRGNICVKSSPNFGTFRHLFFRSESYRGFFISFFVIHYNSFVS